MNNKSKILISALALLLVTSIGYALFSETISISGTASAKGSFDMKISNAKVVTEKGSTGATAVPSPDGNSLVITVPKLEYPGAYVDVNYTIKNNGTIESFFDTYNISGETENIKARFVLNKYYYKVNEEKEETIRIYWAKNTNTNTNTDENTSIVINYSFNQVSGIDDACNKMQLKVEDYKLYLNQNSYERIYDFNFDGFITGADSGIFISLKPKECQK